MTKRSTLFITLLVILGLVGYGLFVLNKAHDTVHRVAIDHDFAYNVTHPFPIEATQLLINEDSLNTSIDYRLNEYDVKNTIVESFLDEGLKPMIDTLLQINDFKIPVTFYDPESRIGFLWLDYNRFGEEFKGSKLPKPKGKDYYKIEFLKLVDIGVEKFLDDEKKLLDEVLGKANEKEELIYRDSIEMQWKATMSDLGDGTASFSSLEVQQLFQEFNSLGGVSPYLRDWNFFGRNIDIYSDYHLSIGKQVRQDITEFTSKNDRIDFIETMLQDLRKKLEVDYIASKANKTMIDEWKLSAADMIRDPAEFFGYLGLIDQLRIFNPSTEFQLALNNQILEIVIEKNKPKWLARGEALMSLLSENNLPGILDKPRYHDLLTDIMNNDKYTKWQNRYQEIKTLGDIESISMEELKVLEILAHQNSIYIAPLSIFDDRTIYDMKEDEYQAQLIAAREKLSQAKSKKKRKALQEALIEISNNRSTNYPKIRTIAKEESKDRLKSDMQKFISWAKEQSQMVTMN